MSSYNSLEEMVQAVAEGVRPPERLTVSQAAEKYRWLNNPGAYVGPYRNDTAPYLVEPMDMLTSTEHTAMIFVGGAQLGKALPLYTPIPTPSGWTTMGDLSVGEVVFGRDGHPCNVTAVTPVMYDHKVYEIEFDDGTTIEADAEHNWYVEDCYGHSHVRTTEELISVERDSRRVPVSAPLKNFLGLDIGCRCDALRRALAESGFEWTSFPGHTGVGVKASFGTRTREMRALLHSLGMKTRVEEDEGAVSLVFGGHREMVSIREVPTTPVRCITVDSQDHLYLAGEQMVPTHNTEMVLNWITHSVICDPADMMVIQTSQSVTRDFGIRRIDRMHRHTKEVGKRLIQRRDSDNRTSKMYQSGMLLTLSWPTINELSGRPIGRLWLTDYDRMDENIDGEGSPFDLARKRATTFGRHGMTVAESSPGYEIDNPRWMPQTPHEAPPTKGVLALYNRGDRRRWYWKCLHCGEWFEPDFSLLQWPDTQDITEAASKAIMPCPHCGGIHEHRHKRELNIKGRWVPDGQRLTADDELIGKPYTSDIVSYWLKGPAAAFATWKTLVMNYLKAEQEYERTGSQEALKTTVNTDQGLPYRPRGTETERLPEELKARAKDFPVAEVPHGVRFLLACVDVQKNRFEVQVHGFSEGGDITVIDRFKIRKSNRLDDDGERFWVNPGAYPEDWDLLTDEVLRRSYPLADGSGRRMPIKLTLCDSGGAKGVTTNAYNYWRRLRDEGDGSHQRFLLVKGADRKGAPRVQISYPDSERKDRSAGARGEVPVLLINTDVLKDHLNNMLDRTDPGGGMVHFSREMEDWWFVELTVEVRTVKGWQNPKGYRNEAWDLLVYAIAGSLTRKISIERINWEAPPGWAEEWDCNDMVFTPKDTKAPDQALPFQPTTVNTANLADLGSLLG